MRQRHNRGGRGVRLRLRGRVHRSVLLRRQRAGGEQTLPPAAQRQVQSVAGTVLLVAVRVRAERSRVHAGQRVRAERDVHGRACAVSELGHALLSAQSHELQLGHPGVSGRRVLGIHLREVQHDAVLLERRSERQASGQVHAVPPGVHGRAHQSYVRRLVRAARACAWH